ncbi:MAG: NADH-quinone oxidoreductase subunit J [Pirellulales bacterium]
MTSHQITLGAAAMLLSALGMWLMLPRGRQGGRLLGAVVGLAGLGCFAWLGQCLGGFTDNAVFGIVGVTAVVAAVAAVTFRSPVYCAIWFALSLLATAGLFMIQGAQFLGVATVVVYAGAILVTFLFVLMLAQPEGHAHYDRVSWEGLLAAVTGSVLVGILTMTVVGVLSPGKEPQLTALFAAGKPAAELLPKSDIHGARAVKTDDGKLRVELLLAAAPQPDLEGKLRTAIASDVAQAYGVSPENVSLTLAAQGIPPQHTPGKRADNILNKEHVAKLGGTLFSKHLIAVEVAGTLLLVALVGAIAILGRDNSPRPTARGTTAVAEPLRSNPRTPASPVVGESHHA